MGQQYCSVNTYQQTSTLNHLLLDDSQIQQQEGGDNPSKQRLGKKFLNTQIVASWNILQDKNLNYQNLQHLYAKTNELEQIENKQESSQSHLIQADNIGNDISKTLINALDKKKYRAVLAPSYQNLEIDVSSFIKIKSSNINDYYQFKQKVGEGTFGCVYRGIQKRTGELRAIKVLKKKTMNNTYKISLIAQLDLLKTLDHPNIIKLYDLFLYDGNYYVITQFCEGGCLQKYYNQRKGQFDEEFIKIIMKQLLSALSYLNTVNVVHRDLKLQNMVFLKNPQSEDGKKNYQIKIIDFGTAIRVQKHKKNQTGLVGTLLYIAPEFTKGFFTEKCDVWSAGIILYILLFSNYPFKGKNQKETLHLITSKLIQYQKLSSTFSKQAKQVVKMMLDKNYLTRSSAKSLMQLEWFRGIHIGRASKQMTQSAASNLANYQRKNNFFSLIQSFLSFKKITQSQRQSLSTMFFQIDIDNSGLIETQQLFQFVKKKFTSFTQQKIKEIVQNVDKNKSGKIDFNEFIMVMAKKTELYADTALREAFDYIDNDTTGVITKKEIKRLLKAADNKEIEEIFSNLDENGDNEITFEQFKAYLKSC